MEIQECYQEALASLSQANDEFDAGEIQKASDAIWLAAAYAVMAIAIKQGWPVNEEHESLHSAATRLADELGDPRLYVQFSLAEKFLANSWHDFMQDYEIAHDRLAVEHFVNRVLSLPELSQAGR